MHTYFRLSRITTPRASLWSVVLLIIASFAFGLSASAAVSADQIATQHLFAEGALGQLLTLVTRV